ncbi:hypothetical protein [Nocardia xishanensis]
MRENPIYQRQRTEKIHYRFRIVVGRDEQIDIADGVAHAAQRPGVVGAAHLGNRREGGDESLGDVQRDRQRYAAP